MDGFLNVLKPPGMTSHDVVAHIRRRARVKTGHTGTLDPTAAGVLVLALGKATRLASHVTEGRKTYRSELTLGTATDTGDREGEVTDRRPVPDFTGAELDRVFQNFTGTLEQKPPMHSALHHRGTRLYELARRGQEVERSPRQIIIHEIQRVDHRGARILFNVTCSKGTYVRVLCADLAAALSTAGHMSFLVRTASGPFSIETASTLEELDRDHTGNWPERLFPLDYPLQGLLALELTEAQGERIARGNHISWEEPLPDSGESKAPVRLYREGRFFALGRFSRENGQLLVKPSKVLL